MCLAIPGKITSINEQQDEALHDEGRTITGKVLIMGGIKKPTECSNFGTNCTPLTPLGAPMVSSEGACAAYYHFSGMAEKAASSS